MLISRTSKASLSCKVVLACRNQSKGEAAIADIKKVHPNAHLELVPIDLQDLSSVRKLAENWEKREDKKLDLLICNAGATFVDYKRTTDGFEQTYQVRFRKKCRSDLVCSSLSPYFIDQLSK